MTDVAQEISVQTTFGTIPVQIRPGPGPVVFVIRGAFPIQAQLCDLDVERAEMAFVHLPGCWSPLLPMNSVSLFASAFDEVLNMQFHGRPVVLLGVSTGALVAMAMRAPHICAIVAVEPFFSTAMLWPLIEIMRGLIAENPGNLPLEKWIKDIFGYTASENIGVDYHHLLNDLTPPLFAVVGEVPLMPRRRVLGMPSLTDEADRQALIAAGAALFTARGGHNVPEKDLPAIHGALVAALARAGLR